MLKWMELHAVSLQPLLSLLYFFFTSTPSPLPKSFCCLPSELFLSDHTKIPSVSLSSLPSRSFLLAFTFSL